jgi:ATP-dependent helicase/nuclease subunit A
MNEASRAQINAAAPATSVWLSANAGSGKTRVLTDRVARLLLQGVGPERILCLTYTKAAAAEMQNRLFKRLGEWAMMPEPDLRPLLDLVALASICDIMPLIGANRTLVAADPSDPSATRKGFGCTAGVAIPAGGETAVEIVVSER